LVPTAPIELSEHITDSFSRVGKRNPRNPRATGRRCGKEWHPRGQGRRKSSTITTRVYARKGRHRSHSRTRCQPAGCCGDRRGDMVSQSASDVLSVLAVRLGETFTILNVSSADRRAAPSSSPTAQLYALACRSFAAVSDGADRSAARDRIGSVICCHRPLPAISIH
jgi:hypothetical protein